MLLPLSYMLYLMSSTNIINYVRVVVIVYVIVAL